MCIGIIRVCWHHNCIWIITLTCIILVCVCVYVCWHHMCVLTSYMCWHHACVLASYVCWHHTCVGIIRVLALAIPKICHINHPNSATTFCQMDRFFCHQIKKLCHQIFFLPPKIEFLLPKKFFCCAAKHNIYWNLTNIFLLAQQTTQTQLQAPPGQHLAGDMHVQRLQPIGSTLANLP